MPLNAHFLGREREKSQLSENVPANASRVTSGSSSLIREELRDPSTSTTTTTTWEHKKRGAHNQRRTVSGGGGGYVDSHPGTCRSVSHRLVDRSSDIWRD